MLSATRRPAAAQSSGGLKTSSFYVFAAVFMGTLFLLNLQYHSRAPAFSAQHASAPSVQLVDGGSTKPLAAAAPIALPRPLAAGRAAVEKPGLIVLQTSPSASAALPYKAEETVTVLPMTGHFFGNDFEGPQKDCTLGSTRINCLYGHSSGASAESADVLWYHIPSLGSSGDLRRHHDKQLLVGMSMESSEYYGQLDSKSFMRAFDIEATYRSCSQVPVYYFDYNAKELPRLFNAPRPFASKKTAIVYVNSNCAARSGRSDIMRQVMALKSSAVPTESWGNCDRNVDAPGSFDKVELIKGYKFCVAMENSITKDYITEKLWQALEAGCLPIYMGPKNVADFLPMRDAIVNYHEFGSPEALMKEVERLAADQKAYDAKLSWKFKKWEELSPTFLNFTLRTHVHQPHTRCQICRVALQHRYAPQAYKTCLFNETWMVDYKAVA